MGFGATIHALTACSGWPALGPAVATAERFQVNAARMILIVPLGDCLAATARLYLIINFFEVMAMNS